MTKKDYIKAAKIVKEIRSEAADTRRVIGASQRLYQENVSFEVEDAFVLFFQNDNPLFDERRFRQACQVNHE